VTEPLLSIRDLRVTFATDGGVARAVDGVSLDLAAGEILGLVGESGCGKSVTAMSVLRLLRPPARIEPGSEIWLDGRDLLALPERAMRSIRGRRIAMVFQEPMTALNPVLTIGHQIAEVVRVHERASRGAARARAVAALEQVGVPDPDLRARQYPHQLSGGTRQRVLLAMALVLHPAVLIADEPTTALDVTVQAELLALLADLQRRLGMAVLLITHDLGVVAELASRVAVMYAGQLVEEAPVQELFARARHPYTQGLLEAAPRLAPRDGPHGSGGRHGGGAGRLRVIPGTVPPATAWPSGCRFHDRCSAAWDRCEREAPPSHAVDASHRARCHLAAEPERRAALPVALTGSVR